MKGIALILFAAVLFVCAFLRMRKPKTRPLPPRPPSPPGSGRTSSPGRLPEPIQSMLKDLEALQARARENAGPSRACPRCQIPYSLGSGSREHPTVIGMEGCSDRLVHCETCGRWFLTDGLGNGWDR